MRIGIASHVVLDTLSSNDGTDSSSVGGPPCYSGITSRQFGFDVILATKVGFDFPEEVRKYLAGEKLMIQQRNFVAAPTTRFRITSEDGSRRMELLAHCAAIEARDIENVKVDCWLVSPVYSEVPFDALQAIKTNGGSKDFVMLDPQGYMRLADETGKITLAESVHIDLTGIRAIKVDEQEMHALTGGLKGLEGMLALQAKGVEFVISTVPNEIHLLHQNTQYWAKISHVDTPDSTGAGDILSGAFCCAYIKEKDPLWALCFGAGALRAALESQKTGLSKVPSYSRIEESASYFYNTIGFRKLS